jgi:tetratricopeptide (TPR) repeat protein
VRDAIVVGLDNWWLVAQGRDAAAHDWLGAVLRAVDPDPLRARIRRAAADRDRRALDELARSDELARQPPTTVASLTWALLELGAYDTVIALLRPAQQRHPDDVWINLDLAQALDLRRPPNYAEALRFFSIVRSLRPETRLQVNLGYLLLKQQDWDGLVTVSRESIALTPPPDPRPLAMAYNHLGIGLARKGELEQAEAAFRKALELNPDFGPAYYNLGRTFHLGRRMDEALAAYERAVQLVSPPNAAAAQGHVPYQAEEQAGLYLSLGQVRYSRKEYAAALAAFDKAIELHPGYAMAHFWRADTLHELRRPDDSIAAYEQAVRYDPTMERAYYNMGVALQGKGRLDKAIAAYSRAIAITPKADSHYNMAKALRYSGDEAGSEAAYRKAIELNPKLAPAHWSLGALLVEEGRFAEALPCLERGCQCRAAADGPEIAEKWVNQARRFVELEAKLPRILDGSDRPATPGERLEYASVCRRKRLDAAAARFYADYLAERPAAADSLEAGHRYLAATVAARAGTGQGHDAAGLDDADRARWRRQALDWLRADLALWTARVDGPPAGRSSARAALQRWRDDKALAGVREPQELAKLPEPERAGYVRFWADVQEVLVRSLAVRPEK